MVASLFWGETGPPQRSWFHWWQYFSKTNPRHIRFPLTKWVCWCLHGTCQHLCAQDEGVVKKGFQSVSIWTSKGLLASVFASILVAVLDCYLQGKKVLLDMHEFGTECDTIYYYAGHHGPCIIKDDTIWQTTSAYINHFFIDENIMFTAWVKQHPVNFGPQSKKLERVFGLKDWGEGNMQKWEWEKKVLCMLRILTWCAMFSLSGKPIGHFPVINWFKVVALFIKRRVAAVTKGWDDKMNDVPLTTMMEEMIARVHQEDPMWGKWCVDDPELNVCIDSSSLATRVSLENDGTAIKDVNYLGKRKMCSTKFW